VTHPRHAERHDDEISEGSSVVQPTRKRQRTGFSRHWNSFRADQCFPWLQSLIKT
jgi:hypothetical protein